jgi:hypothetical protein
MQPLEELEKILYGLNPGIVPMDLKEAILKLLERGWNELDGSLCEGMEPRKVRRAEDPIEWYSPNLYFLLERHGATVLGSTRAEMQRWEINLKDRLAEPEKAGLRQLRKMDSRWPAKTVAEEIARIILNGVPDRRIQKTKNGKIKLISSEVFPPSTNKMTRQYRSRKFYRELMEILEPYGFERTGNFLTIPASVRLQPRLDKVSLKEVCI